MTPGGMCPFLAVGDAASLGDLRGTAQHLPRVTRSIAEIGKRAEG